MNSYSFMSKKKKVPKWNFSFFRSTPERALICGCKLGPEKIPVHNTCFHYLSSFRCALATISVHYWLLASPSEIMDSQCNERISTKQSVSATASKQAKNRNKLNGSQCRINGWKTWWKLRFHGLCWIITKWCTNDPKWTNYIVQKEEEELTIKRKRSASHRPENWFMISRDLAFCPSSQHLLGTLKRVTNQYHATGMEHN